MSKKKKRKDRVYKDKVFTRSEIRHVEVILVAAHSFLLPKKRNKNKNPREEV